MRVPFTWLKDYVELHEDVHEVADLLQQVGVPVENIIMEGAQISGVKVGQIKSVEPHPDAERLRVCQVDMGEGNLQIVTAATNVRVDQIVAVATHGSLLASGTKIKKGKLRGVLSEGMFCSAAELGMDPMEIPEDQRAGILDLDPKFKLGSDIQDVLPVTEAVLDIEAFANRCDQLSILGIARELAAKLRRPLLMPQIMEDYDKVQKSSDDPDFHMVEIEDLTACPRFIARTVDNVKIGPSPSWMAKRLQLAGMRSVNNVVDITNYVMLEVGQPLHAYDRASLAQGRLIVRRANPQEELTTLDGDKRQMPKNAIVIADPEKAVGAAGVMGGLYSEITENTKELYLEAAAFDSADVRRCSLRLGLRTEASKRFEKGMDTDRVQLGCQRCAYLLNQYAGTVSSIIVDKGCARNKAAKVDLRLNRVSHLLGVNVPKENVLHILTSLGFGVEDKGDLLTVQVPGFRNDVTEEVDLIEEVARHFGYDNFPSTLPKGTSNNVHGKEDEYEEWVRDCMISLGLNEILTPSLQSQEYFAKYRIDIDTAKILNPLSEEQRVLRPYMFPFITETILRNLRVRNRDMRFFEISKVFRKNGQDVDEPKHLSVGLCYEKADFFALKGIVQHFANMVGVNFTAQVCQYPWLHPGRSAKIVFADETVGWLGEIHPELSSELDCDLPLIICEINLALVEKMSKTLTYKSISRLPSVERDLAFVAPLDVPAGTMSKRFAQVGGAVLSSVECFDVYVGPQVPEGMKSMAFRFILQPFEKTLTEEDIQKTVNKIVKIAEREYKAVLR